MFARNLESPFIPNEKSSSSVSSNRCFCASVSTEYASCFVSAADSSGYSSGLSTPCTLTIGAELVVMCRSEPPCSIIFRNSSLNATSGITSSHLFHGFSYYLFEGRHSQSDLFQPALSQSKHSLFYCLAAQFQPR